MTSTLPTDQSFSGSWSWGITSSLGNYADLAKKSWADVASVEFLPGVCIGDDKFSVPEAWLPAGATRRMSWRVLHLADAEGVAIPSASSHGQALRLSIVALSLPRLTHHGVKVYKPSSWMGYGRKILLMARWSLAHSSSSDGTLWSHLSESQWSAMHKALSKTASGVKTLEYLTGQLRQLGVRGLLADYPSVDIGVLSPETMVSVEESRREHPPLTLEPRAWKATFQPFSDEFVTDFIAKAIWFQENVAADLIECWKQIRDADIRMSRLRSAGHPDKVAERKRIIKSYDWRSASGERITNLPWLWSRPQGKKKVVSTEWPPRDYASLKTAVSLLQAMNFCLVAFCSGARQSEILAATTKSLDEVDGRLVSKTFKLSDELEGQLREWPLHPVAIRALELQLLLSSVVKPTGAEHIWVLLSNGIDPAGSPMLGIDGPMLAVIRQLQLEEMLGKERLNPHRWRHTIARLVGLAVATAPQVLQDLFGHRDFEMTLRYMLSDPEIAQEALRVAEETAQVIAREAIEEIDSGEAGGAAAEALAVELRNAKMERGEDTFSVESLTELTEVLTFGGRYWQLVRPGVICTKSLGQYGPCTRGRGRPDAGACRTGCGHRLELARAQRDCAELTQALLRELNAAYRQDQVMLIANLEGQVLSNLQRWPEVCAAIVNDSPTARRIWTERRNDSL